MKKIVILLMSLFLVINMNAQKHVPYGQQIGVILNDYNTGDDITVTVTCDIDNVETEISIDNFTLNNENFNPNNNYFTTIVGDTANWTLGTNYKIHVGDNVTINVNSVPFTNVAQHLAETDTTKNYVKILHDGKYLYVDTCDTKYSSSLYTTKSNAIDKCAILPNITLNNGEILTSQLCTLSELKSITNQIYKFKTTTIQDNSYFFINTDNTNNGGNYWVFDNDNSFNIVTLQKRENSVTLARFRCVYK